MSKVTYSIQEGISGILYLTDNDGNIETYRPNKDFDKARKYLYDFRELETNFNKKIKDTFILNKKNWYPTINGKLYSQFFFVYVQYEGLIERYLKGEVRFSKIGPGRFRNLINILSGNKVTLIKKATNYIRFLASSLIMVRNKIIVKSSKKSILFLRESFSDCRTNDVLTKIKSQVSVLQLIPFPRKNLQLLFDSSFFIWPLSSNNNYILPDEVLRTKIDGQILQVFKFALNFSKQEISKKIIQYNLIKRSMVDIECSALVSIDDCDWAYPFIFAAKDNEIKCIGLQHGLYAKRHEQYVMGNIDNYLWFDYLLVWGDYWKELFLKYNKIFKPENVIVTTQLKRLAFLPTNNIFYQSTASNRIFTKSILIPFEFLTDTMMVGKFITEFYKRGFNIYLKTRADDIVEDQLMSYELKSLKNNIIIVEEINSQVMADIDIIAGTMSTLLYDLLPFNKPTWILDTPCKFGHDMIENGFAHLFKWEDLNIIENIYNKDMKKQIKTDNSYLIGNVQIADVIIDLI